jgi:hypothetical protein
MSLIEAGGSAWSSCYRLAVELTPPRRMSADRA